MQAITLMIAALYLAVPVLLLNTLAGLAYWNAQQTEPLVMLLNTQWR